MTESELLKIILPAIIGAGGAIIVFLIKDLILIEYRESRNRKQQMLDRRLSQLYGPLLVAMKGGEGTLANIFREDTIFEKFMSNMHLLSPELQEIADSYMKLGRVVRANEMSLPDQKKALKLSQQFNEILIKESETLREQFNGGFWRSRLAYRWIRKRLESA